MAKHHGNGTRIGSLIVLYCACLALVSAALAAPPDVGSPAPAFHLQDQAGAWHDLNGYRGKWVVLYFYPKDDTPGCTTQACEFRDNIFAFNKVGAVILGISVDDVASHKQFAEEHKLPFTLLADQGGRVRKAYGVPGVLGLIPGRVTYVIDRTGTVRHIFNSMTNIDKHVGDALEVVRQLQAEQPA